MTKLNSKAAPEAADLRQRAARARDAAGRFIKRAPPAEVPAATGVLPPEDMLAAAIEVADAPLQTLLALHDVADMLSEMAAAVGCQPRCYVGGAYRGHTNAAGVLADWILSACGQVADAAIAEAWRRRPGTRGEQALRLMIIARSAVGSGYRPELTRFTRDTAALAAEMEA